MLDIEKEIQRELEQVKNITQQNWSGYRADDIAAHLLIHVRRLEALAMPNEMVSAKSKTLIINQE